MEPAELAEILASSTSDTQGVPEAPSAAANWALAKWIAYQQFGRVSIMDEDLNGRECLPRVALGLASQDPAPLRRQPTQWNTWSRGPFQRTGGGRPAPRTNWANKP